MVRTWSDDNPKAAMMTRKRALIVDAAQAAFLEGGYAESSVNRIAENAGVSIKTLYRHFESKDELFSAVMEAACKSFTVDSHGQVMDPEWFACPPAEALPVAGAEYLRFALSREQLGIYRVLTRDSIRFPALARRYQDAVIKPRNAAFGRSLNRWTPKLTWSVKDTDGASELFEALLKARLFDEALHTLITPEDSIFIERGKVATLQFLKIAEAGLL